MPKISRAELIRLQKKHKTDQGIANQFGITRQAIHQLRQKYGLSYNKDKNLRRDMLIYKYFKNGMPGTKISKKVGLSISQTYRSYYKISATHEKKKGRG